MEDKLPTDVDFEFTGVQELDEGFVTRGSLELEDNVDKAMDHNRGCAVVESQVSWVVAATGGEDLGETERSERLSGEDEIQYLGVG
ncbi:hypothetical protein R6Q57_013130 [Mikania cordata]